MNGQEESHNFPLLNKEKCEKIKRHSMINWQRRIEK